MALSRTPKEIEVTLGKGVKGTLCLPVDSGMYIDGTYASAKTNKAALILHGQGGHRNYCYQKLLAHRLAYDLGIYSLRIDFRGCGESADNADPIKARLISQDIEDIQAGAEFLINGLQNPLGINFTLSSVIGHSRGAAAMFVWAIQQDKLLKSQDASKAIVVPNLINCSSRFRLPTVYQRYGGSFEAYVPSMRHGKIQPVLVTKHEIDSLAAIDFSYLPHLSLEFSVLSIYGLKDEIIPVNDFAYFANSLNRGLHSHHLEIIPGADHNFYGVHLQEPDETDKEFNPSNLPLNKRGQVNYNYQVVDIIIKYLRPEEELKRFIYSNYYVGEVSRWKHVEGISNFRDIGGWLIRNRTIDFPIPSDSKLYVKTDVVFRSSTTVGVTKEGALALQKLRVKAIFDFRSDIECIRDGVPMDLSLYGIDRYHTPVFSKQNLSPDALAIRYSNLMKSWSTFVNVYDEMLLNGTEAFRQIFSYIENMESGSSILFHCTAGKDRTGVMVMLILLLMGVDKHTIAKEYELTTIGLVPEHKQIKLKFLQSYEKIKNSLGDLDEILKGLSEGRENWSIEKEGFENLISSRYEAMLDTIEMFNEKYGGIYVYMNQNLSFSDSSIKAIYQKLLQIKDVEDTEDNPIMNILISTKTKL